MVMLKSEIFNYNGCELKLNELSAQQRMDYIAFLAKAEKNLPKIADLSSDSEIQRLMLRMDIESGAFVVANSLWHNNRSGISPEEIAKQILTTWPPEALREAELIIKRLSTMLHDNVESPADGENNDDTEDESITVTAEKPTPVS